ncbi:MAG: ABC transporter ATP-binding protein [Rhodobacteraceae bacterium]|nr:ABC transporter ATP-binding protein [Paracoccaceae bacterium]
MTKHESHADNQAQPIVQFVGVEKTYDGKVNVVEALDLDIEQGEFLTFLGPSGSGKTTTLMMLAGFEEPTAGEILLNGESINRVPPFRRNMGVVFQNYALFPHMTVGENVAYSLKQRRMPKAEIAKKTLEALAMVELEAAADRHPGQLSGGQQQRVALARALVFEPSIVLMDEPLGALDKNLREQMQIEIKRLHDRLPMTFVYVTHDQTEALTMSDRVAIFNDGKIQQLDTAQNVYEAPANDFVANFVGENNRIAGQILTTDGDQCQVQIATGQTITAINVLQLQPGDRTNLSIRPERLRVSQDESGMISMTIKEVIYFGDHIRVTLVTDSTELVAKTPISLTKGMNVGGQVSVTWDVENCRALDVHDEMVA